MLLLWAWDHPRRCGENSIRRSRSFALPGSPPQVRGKPSRALSVVNSDRITPAGAGKTVLRLSRSLLTQDHPRRCGENPLAAVRMTVQSGSPPQVRGKLPDLAIFLSRMRITPAGAGKTIFSCADTNAAKDHPRRCGENSYSNGVSRENSGSPPQVRGKLLARCFARRSFRITPAGAGKTFILQVYPRKTQDHPRRCGENRTITDDL